MGVSRRGVLLSTLALSALAFAQLAPIGSAASLPTATAFTGVVVTSDVAAPAGAPNNPDVIVVQDRAFWVTVSFDAPLSYNRDSTVSFTVPSATTAALGGTRSVVVPAGASMATASGVTLSPAENQVQIKATVTAGPKTAKEVPPGLSNPFDVVIQEKHTDASDTFLNTEGTRTGCVPTKAVPQCADLVLPFKSLSGALLTVGKCDTALGCDAANDSVVQALAAFSGDYTRTTPATLILKCDKTSCQGGGVSSYVPLVNLAATGGLSPATACKAKGVVDADKDYCVDYVQSKRDGAGDLILYLLFWRDFRGSCC